MERGQERGNLRLKHKTSLKIRQETFVSLTKPHDAPTFTRDQAHTEARAPAITQRRAGDGFKPRLRLDLAEAFQLLGPNLLFGLKLDFRAQMLEVAATAGAVVWARWRDAVRARFQDFHQPAAVVTLVPVNITKAHALARQRAFDEYGLAFKARHAAAVVAEGGHPGNGNVRAAL